MSASSPAVDPQLVARVEAHSLYSWPPSVVRHIDGGWVLRATPGLARGRSNHALTPSDGGSLADDGALETALLTAEGFAEEWGIPLGLQVSPVENHSELLSVLLARGWRIDSEAVVMWALSTTVLAAGAAQGLLDLRFSDEADREWLAAWAQCEPRRTKPKPGEDIDSHVQTVFALMGGRARFACDGQRAVGISVAVDGMLGLFCLAVDPAVRRQGLGRRLVTSMVSASGCDSVYLQVLSDNVAGLALYECLGFEAAYRYCHCLPPSAAG